jgi:lysyl-tRNA synthetase, class I
LIQEEEKQMGKKGTHWADRLAEQIIRKRGAKHLVQIGVSPSGPIHVGFLRETILGDVLRRALMDAGAEARLVLFVDSMDPLRKLYPFLEESFEKYIGKPLCDIPDPYGKEASYADAFLKPFVHSLNQLGLEIEIVRSEEKYRSGFFTQQITQVLDAKDKIAEIIREVSGRDLSGDWMPVNVVSPLTGRITGNRILNYDTSKTIIEFEDDEGNEGSIDYSEGGAKLPWRIDWPARWNALGVTVEPFGKDHSSPGGSYDTGKRMVREIFGTDPPEPVPYEWINLKGQGAMSSSKGIAISIGDIVDVVPPEVLRYLIIRERPNAAIDFDPANKLIQIVEEFENLERRILRPEGEVNEVKKRSYELSRIRPEEERIPAEIPFRLLSTLIQVAVGDEENLKNVLVRTGYAGELDRWAQVQQLVEYAGRWLERFAPEEAKMPLSKEVPAVAMDLAGNQKEFLRKLADYLEEDRTAEEIHQKIYDLATELELKGPEAFRAVYLSLIGKERGPRAGFFLASLDGRFVRERFREVGSV